MIRRLLGNQTERRELTFSDIWKRGLDTTQRTTSGETVDYDSALTISAVFGAIRLLSDSVSTLDLDVLYRSSGSEQKFRPLPRHRAATLQHHRPLLLCLCLWLRH